MRLALWIVAFVAIFLGIYIRDLRRTPTDVSMIQTSLSRFSFDLLRERQPLVFHDQVPDLTQVTDAWFKLQRTMPFQLHGEPSKDIWQKNRYKYILLSPHEDDTEVLLYPAGRPMLADGAPDPEGAPLIAVQLRAHQLLIVPYRWTYLIPKKPMSAVGVHDWITFLLP